MVGSLSVLPALLHKLGDRVEKGQIPYLGRFRGPPATRGSGRAVLRRVLRRPGARRRSSPAGRSPPQRCPCSGCTPSSRASPTCRTACRSSRRTSASRRPSPARRRLSRWSSRATDVTSPAYQRAYEQAQLLRARDRTALPAVPRASSTRTTRWRAIELSIAGTGDDATSYAALRTLRDQARPADQRRRSRTPRSPSPARPRARYDFNEMMKARAPLVIGFVLGLAFLLLLVTFRSLVIPLTAIVLNLLSVGAAYGILIMIFQWGHLESAARLRLQPRDHLLAPALPVRDPVRAVDGLPRLHHQPDQGAPRPRPDHRAGGRARHPADGGNGHRGRDRDGRRVRDLRRAARDRRQADGRRPGDRDPDRRDRHPGGAAAGDDEAARRVELVPAAAARAACPGSSSPEAPPPPTAA